MIVTNPFQEVKSQVPMIEVVTRYTGIKLRKSGSRWTGNCPLHDERTPSFYVFPDGGWKCFGCGASGDSIDLVARLFGIKPLEAAEKIAEDFNIPQGWKKRSLNAKLALQRQEEKELQAAFQRWVDKTSEILCLYYRCINRVLDNSTPGQFMDSGDMVMAALKCEHMLDILDGDDMEAKLDLWRSGETEVVLCGTQR